MFIICESWPIWDLSDRGDVEFTTCMQRISSNPVFNLFGGIVFFFALDHCHRNLKRYVPGTACKLKKYICLTYSQGICHVPYFWELSPLILLDCRRIWWGLTRLGRGGGGGGEVGEERGGDSYCRLDWISPRWALIIVGKVHEHFQPRQRIGTDII